MNAIEEMGHKYLQSIEMVSGPMQILRLMGKIGSANQYGHMIPSCWWVALKDLCEPKRFKKFKKRLNKRKKNRAAPKRSAKVRVKVTRTVKYTYDEADNERLGAFYSTSEWKLIRYEALRLHGGCCQCCGAAPGLGVVLNVDHIKPLRVFWDLRLDINNLQVLCGDCNEGKGARHADDWRPAATEETA